MEFWSTNEAWREMSDVINDMQYKTIDPRLNAVLSRDDYAYRFDLWALITVCVPKDILPIFPEVVKRHVKRKTLEFRLQIDYDSFFNGTEQERYRILFDNLNRCVDLMPTLKVPTQDIEKLKAVVQEVRTEFVA